MNSFSEISNKIRDRLLNAVLEVFSAVPFKKASLREVAKRADISKTLLFYYFQDKKTLYINTFEFCSELIADEIKKGQEIKNETDFFEIITFTQNLKFGLTNRYPKIFDFMKNAYSETDIDIKQKIYDVRKKYITADMASIFSKADFSKFKDGISSEMALSIITWVAEGFVASRNQTSDIDALRKEFDKYLEILKKSFYKEKYL